MSCDGNCSACPIQCVSSKLNKLKPKETETMSEGAINCKIGTEEKIVAVTKDAEFNQERNSSVKTIAIIALVVACVAAFVAWTAMRDLQAVYVQIEKQSQEIRRIDLKADSAKEEATRGYNYVRKNKSSL